MLTFTETRIHIADLHTTLCYLHPPPPASPPLPFRSDEEYRSLHAKLAKLKGIEYCDVNLAGRTAVVLGRLTPSYRDNKYWRYYLPMSLSAYPFRAWREHLPIEASVSGQIDCKTGKEFPFRVRPVPRVILYPFGWSTWISLRLLGDHNVSHLVAFLELLFTDPAFRYVSGSNTFSLKDLFDDVATGIRIDAFDGEKTEDVFPQEWVTVTTVIAKHGGSLSVKALGDSQQAELLRIARPYGRPPKGEFLQQCYPLQANSEVEYMVHHKLGRFLWVDHLLEPKDRNYGDLCCYHNNSFRSLVHAWHLHALLDEAAKHPPLTGVVLEFVRRAIELLETPPYKCASLRQYTDEKAVKDSLQKAKLLVPS